MLVVSERKRPGALEGPSYCFGRGRVAGAIIEDLDRLIQGEAGSTKERSKER